MDDRIRRDTVRARALRNAASPAERLLWAHISRRQLAGQKFSRQMPIGPYFADFLCRESRLVVEVDGYSHDARVDHDRRRDAFIREQGYRIVRFTNNDVSERLEGVLVAIADALDKPQQPHPQPLPQAGGAL